MAGFTDVISVVIKASSAAAVQELNSLQKEASRTDQAMDSLGKKIGLTGSAIKAGLAAGAVALVGTGLVKFLQDSVAAFGDAAKAAGELATATGGSVEEVSRMQAALEDSGVSAETSAALLTKFTTNAGKNSKALADLGVVMKTNKDGSIDYADAMVQTVDAIDKIGDSSKRNQLLVQFFGKQGAAAFNELRASGVSLADSMKAIDTARVFGTSDVQAAYEYDQAIDDLNASFKGIQFVVGKEVVPALSDLINMGTGVIEFFTTLPGPVVQLGEALGIAGLAVYGLGKAFAFLKGEAVGTLIVGLLDSIALLPPALFAAETAAGKAGVAFGVLGNAAKSLAVAAAPMIILTAAVTALMGAMESAKNIRNFISDSDNLNVSLREQAQAVADTDSVWSTFVNGNNVEKIMGNIAVKTRDAAEASLENADATEAERAAAQALIDIMGEGSSAQQAANLDTEEGRKAQEAYARSLSASATASKEATDKQRDLADIVANGATSQQELTDAVVAAGEAQAEQNRISETSKRLMDEYAAATYGAVDATFALFDKEFAAADAHRAANKALEDYNATMKDTKATEDDRASALDDLVEAQLRDVAAAAASTEQQDLLNGSHKDAAYYIGLQVDALQKLVDSHVLPADAEAQLQTFIGQLETAQTKAGEGINAEVGVTISASVDTQMEVLKQQIRQAGQAGNESLVQDLQARLDALTADQTADVTVVVTNADVVAATLSGLAAPRSSVLTITADTGAAQGQYDSLDDWRESQLRVILDDTEAQAQYAVLDDWRETHLTVVLDGADAVRATLDRLDDWRTVRINVETSGVGAARAALASVGANSAGAQSLGRIGLPQPTFNPTYSPVNMVRVSVDGRELRSVVRDEIQALSPTLEAVA